MWLAVKCLGALALFWVLVSMTYGLAPWAAVLLILLACVGRVPRVAPDLEPLMSGRRPKRPR